MTAPVLGGGPLIVERNGAVFSWDPSQPVNFAIDQGPLGGLSSEEASNIVREALAQWEGVPSSSLRFEDNGTLDVDVSCCDQAVPGYYETFLDEGDHPENPIVFDSDGQIVDDLLGVGSSDTVLGFAGIRVFDEENQRFVAGWAVLNGKDVRPSRNALLRPLILHEFGHLIGLAHSQAGHQFEFPLVNRSFIPVMFPTLFAQAPQEPILDDAVWLSWLYPAEGFREATGTIRGKVLRRTGGAFQGANVVAVRVADGEETKTLVSVVSDFLITNDGRYELPGLPAGDYYIYIEPLKADFVRESAVGPFDARFTNFQKDYYNGENESGTDSDQLGEKVVIHVEAGQTVENIDLISNETINRLDLLGDDDEMSFEFPEGFSFPFFGQVYTAVVVNSDGNLTFTAGDSQPGAARSEERFLAGLPRIAPLFTDLDPGVGGDVSSTFNQNQITFLWQDVPEFTEFGNRPGNTFSVTLFSNGDINFRYQQINVIPDDNLQAIVGVTPGSGAPGQTIDFSALTDGVSMRNAAIYELFPGNSFDLVGATILFQAATHSLYFPLYLGDQNRFSGYAVSSDSAGAAKLSVEGRGDDGELLPFPDNPHSAIVASRTQLARLGSEFFGVGLATLQRGWIQILSNTDELASFFQFGNGLSGPLTKMDGSVALRQQSTTLYFTRVYDGIQTFPSLSGPQDAQTTLSLANPNTETVRLRFTLFDPAGQPIGPTAERTLQPQSVLFEGVGSIFNQQAPLSGGFVQVEVLEGPGAIGFELIELADTFLGLNASFGSLQNVAFSAQLATGLSVFTSLKVVNTSESQRTLTLTAFGDDGSVIGVLGQIVLDPNQSLQRNAGEIFKLGPGPDMPITGSIRLEADGPGIIGDVVFGDPASIEFAAALALQTERFVKAIFSQVANVVTPGDPSKSTFTGIAFFNPGPQIAQITVQVFDRDGQLVGETAFSLGANERRSNVVTELVAASSGLIRGYIIAESTSPVVAQQLFGNNSLQFLSAVPPRVVQ